MSTENNILLADFMGFKKANVKSYKGNIYSYWLPEGFELIKLTDTTIEGINCEVLEEQDLCMLEDLKFNLSWDWLMPIVEKIENFRFYDSPNSMRFDVKIRHHSCYINDWEIEGKNFIKAGGYNSKIEAVYDACVQFVKWYNSKPKLQC